MTHVSTMGLPRGWLLLALCLLPVLASPPRKARAEAGPILINEVLGDPATDWDGSGALSLRDDEWVEIVNAGPATVDLAGYRLAGADTSWRYEWSGLLAPGEVRVVYGSGSYAWEQANGEALVGLRLNNTGGTIGLWRLAAGDTTLVDCYTYLDHEAEDDRSSGRLPDGGTEWRIFDAMNPYSGTVLPLGSGCGPSPGGAVSCPTPVEEETWGRLKARFSPEKQ